MIVVTGLKSQVPMPVAFEEKKEMAKRHSGEHPEPSGSGLFRQDPKCDVGMERDQQHSSG
jgi:hypothetical protein